MTFNTNVYGVRKVLIQMIESTLLCERTWVNGAIFRLYIEWK